jgi:sugar (glycoside-pentoside-hexuronide) transporter
MPAFSAQDIIMSKKELSMASASAAIETNDPQRPHIGIGKRVGYAMGDFACNCSYSLVQGYLMYFMSDVARINIGTVGTVQLISRAWDAINDPIVGALADKTKSRWGRYRPWVLFAAVPMLIVNVLTFTTNPNWSIGFRTIWALGTYFVLVLVYTMVNIPYSAMPTALTLSAVDRSKFASTRMSFAFLATTLLNFFTLRVVQWAGAGNEQRGFQMGAIIFSAIALPFFIICFASQKEVVQMSYRKTSYKKFLGALKGNKPTLMCLVAFLAQGVSAGGTSARMYFFRYYAGNVIWMANIATMGAIFSVLGTMSLTFLVGKVKNKGTLPMTSYAISATANICNFFVSQYIRSGPGLILYCVFSAITSFAGGLTLSSMFGIMPDLNEYTAYHYGITAVAGFLSSFINFAMKIGQAVAIAMAGWVLAGLGYTPNVDQSPAMLLAFRVMLHIFPAFCTILASISMSQYKLDKKTHEDYIAKLARGEHAPGVVLDEEIK